MMGYRITEKDVLVAELKGILSKLECEIRDAKFQLGTDNISTLAYKIDQMRLLMDRVSQKVDSYKNTK